MPPFEFPPGMTVSIGGPLPPQSKPYPETQLEEMFGPLGPAERMAVLMSLFTMIVPSLLPLMPRPGAGGEPTAAGRTLTPEQMEMMAARRVEDIKGRAQRAYTGEFPDKPLVSKALEPPITQRGMRPGSPEALATSELMAIGEPKPTETLQSMLKYMAESPRAADVPPVGAFTPRTGYIIGRIERGGEPPGRFGQSPPGQEPYFGGEVGELPHRAGALNLSPSDRRQLEGIRELVGSGRGGSPSESIPTGTTVEGAGGRVPRISGILRNGEYTGEAIMNMFQVRSPRSLVNPGLIERLPSGLWGLTERGYRMATHDPTGRLLD